MSTATTKVIKAPRTMPQLREALGTIMAGAANGQIDQDNARVALNAATRIIESVQAETRVRALAFASRQVLDNSMPLDKPMILTGGPPTPTPTPAAPEGALPNS